MPIPAAEPATGLEFALWHQTLLRPMATKRSTPASSRSAGGHPSLHLDAFLPYRLNMLSSLVADRFARSYAAYSERFGIDGPRWRVISFLGERRAAQAEHAAPR